MEVIERKNAIIAIDTFTPSNMWHMARISLLNALKWIFFASIVGLMQD